jgi:hypothetical protein
MYRSAKYITIGTPACRAKARNQEASLCRPIAPGSHPRPALTKKP